MWRPNAERYEPAHLFDTPRGVAGLAWENLRERMLAEYWAAESQWRGQGGRLTAPRGGLLIQAGGLAGDVIKGPGGGVWGPGGVGFVWGTRGPRPAGGPPKPHSLALPP